MIVETIYLDSLGLGVFQSLNKFNIIQHITLRSGELTKKSVLKILQQSFIITERKWYIIDKNAQQHSLIVLVDTFKDSSQKHTIQDHSTPKLNNFSYQGLRT